MMVIVRDFGVALQYNLLTDSKMLKLLPLPEGGRSLRYSLSASELHCKVPLGSRHACYLKM